MSRIRERPVRRLASPLSLIWRNRFFDTRPRLDGVPLGLLQFSTLRNLAQPVTQVLAARLRSFRKHKTSPQDLLRQGSVED
jgi:hypothetical protein